MTDTPETTETPTPNISVVGYDALCAELATNDRLMLVATQFHVAPEEVEDFNLPGLITRDDNVFDLYEIDLEPDTPFDELFKNNIMTIREMGAWQLMYLVDPGRTITSMVFPQGQSMPDQSMSNTYNILNYEIGQLVRDTALDIEQASKDGLSENFPALKDAFEVCQTQYRLVFDHHKTTFTVLNVDTFTPLPIKDVVCVVDAITQTKLMIDPRRAVDFVPLSSTEQSSELMIGQGLLLPPLSSKSSEVGRYFSYVTDIEDNHLLLDMVTGLSKVVTPEALGEMMWVPFDKALEATETPTAH